MIFIVRMKLVFLWVRNRSIRTIMVAINLQPDKLQILEPQIGGDMFIDLSIFVY